MVSKMVGIKIKKGQHLHLETPGGGGYGKASERDLKAVVRDVGLGYVTPEGAKRDYSVVLNENGTVDQEQTDKLRALVSQ